MGVNLLECMETRGWDFVHGRYPRMMDGVYDYDTACGSCYECTRINHDRQTTLFCQPARNVAQILTQEGDELVISISLQVSVSSMSSGTNDVIHIHDFSVGVSGTL